MGSLLSEFSRVRSVSIYFRRPESVAVPGTVVWRERKAKVARIVNGLPECLGLGAEVWEQALEYLLAVELQKARELRDALEEAFIARRAEGGGRFLGRVLLTIGSASRWLEWSAENMKVRVRDDSLFVAAKSAKPKSRKKSEEKVAVPVLLIEVQLGSLSDVQSLLEALGKTPVSLHGERRAENGSEGSKPVTSQTSRRPAEEFLSAKPETVSA